MTKGHPMRTFLTSAAMLLTAAAIMSLSGAPHAVAQTGNAPFCLKTATGQLNCGYSTMAQCEQARGSQSADQCITRSDASGTTGLGDRRTAPQDTPGGPSGS